MDMNISNLTSDESNILKLTEKQFRELDILVRKIVLLEDEKDAHLFNDYLGMDWEIPYQQFMCSTEWIPSENQYHFEVYLEEITNKGSKFKLLTKMLPSPKLALDFVNRNHKSIKGKLLIQYGMCLA